MRASRLIPVLLALSPLTVATAQQGAPQKAPIGWEFTGVPAINFDSDEGFGYGAILELYNYGNGTARPYALTIQPTLFFTTHGRRDLKLFVDAPDLKGGWRASAYVAREQQLATPYYGIGNNTTYVESLETGANEYFYRFGRTQKVATLTLQHAIGTPRLRALLGAGVNDVTTDATPFDKGTTLYAADLEGAIAPHDKLNFARAGLVFDSRDRETGPTHGTWAELVAQRVDKSLGSTHEYTRLTGTVREYVPITHRVVFAQRVIVQQVSGDAPSHDLSVIQSSFKNQEGLGGSSSIRGVPRNRFIGKGTVLSNSELRWHVRDKVRFGKPTSLVLSTFLDAGRVWSDDIVLSEVVSQLHVGYGAGARVGIGPNFVVALDVGHSSLSTAPFYIGLGYLF
ncbi:MAG: hypothetical protein JWO05_1564 [Gemmatimonadetes bacterium]|nr:hypothetical protein [Gemmatimonadota bacterium]